MKPRQYLSLFIISGVVALLLANTPAYNADRAIKKVPTSHKVVALTFDDGPDPATTGPLLNVLAARQARATFFILGTSAEKYPELLASIAAAGQEVASHSYSHRFPNKLSEEELAKELAMSEQILTTVAPKPALFRPPGGGYNDRLVHDLRQRGYTTILWSVDPRDWERRSAKQVFDTVVSRIEPGAIILLHEGECAAATPAAVGMIIDRLRQDGYEFLTVSELLQYYEMRH